MSEIDQKYAALGGDHGLLGRPVGSETVNPDGRGRRRQYQFGRIYWSPGTGAHEVHGDINAKWASLDREGGVLGYPTSDEHDAPGGGRISDFEHGSIRWRSQSGPLIFVQHNMALLPWAPFEEKYKGSERDKAIESLIEYLRDSQPAVVGLSEVFVDSEKTQIWRELEAIYPYSSDGPDEADVESDGGLLLLSHYPMISKHQTIYRQSTGDDKFANKGVLHARIDVPGHPAPYDIFLSHTQNPNSDVARKVLQAQLTHLASFIMAYSSPLRPALLMGDLNTDGRGPVLYSDLKSRLGFTWDLWITSSGGTFIPLLGWLFWPPGITSGDPANNFKLFDNVFDPSTYNPPRPSDDPGRHLSGERIDYFLSWPGTRHWPSYRNTEVLVWQSSPGRDISDHYGLRTYQFNLRSFRVTIDLPIREVKLELDRFHCLEETDEIGDDTVDFQLAYKPAQGIGISQWVGNVDDVASGDIYTYKSPVIFRFGDPGDWLDITIKGREKDDWSGDDELGSRTIRLQRRELLELLGRSATRVLMLTGDGGEYAVSVIITVK